MFCMTKGWHFVTDANILSTWMIIVRTMRDQCHRIMFLLFLFLSLSFHLICQLRIKVKEKGLSLSHVKDGPQFVRIKRDNRLLVLQVPIFLRSSNYSEWCFLSPRCYKYSKIDSYPASTCSDCLQSALEHFAHSFGYYISYSSSGLGSCSCRGSVNCPRQYCSINYYFINFDSITDCYSCF